MARDAIGGERLVEATRSSGYFPARGEGRAGSKVVAMY
jgi:hypothetical protein